MHSKKQINIFRIALYLILSTSCIELSAQVDYTEFKSRFPLTCTKFDSASTMEAKILLDSLSQFEITKGKSAFLHDNAMTYYILYALGKSEIDLKKSSSFYEAGLEEFADSRFAWGLAINYKLDEECEKSRKYAEIYEKFCRKEAVEIDYQQLFYLYKACCD